MKTIILDGHSFTKTKGKKYHYNSSTRRHLYQYVWEKANGDIPKGYEIHHIDMNTDNNDLSNLQLLTIEEHRDIHKGIPWSEERIELARKNLHENALPKAKEWHGSDDGKAWHKKHYENFKDSILKKEEYVCECCGKKFTTTKKSTNRFCSNNCRSKWRRDSGIDDIDRVCEFCGEKFSANKYSKTKTCSLSCANKKKWEKRKLKDSPNLQEYKL